MKTTAVTNASVVLEGGIIWDGVILISGERILKVGTGTEIEIPPDAVIIDADGAYVGPGFVDIHVHGGGGFETHKEPLKAAEFFLCHGTTTLLGTPVYTQPFDDMLDSINKINDAMKKSKVIKGMYLEGPYMNPKYGSFADLNPWRGPIDPAQYKPLVDAAGLNARVWAIAPEREGLIPFLEYARSVNPDVVFAVGHSEATPAEIRRLGKYKPTIQTHSMCATGRLPVFAGTRAYGPDEYCFTDNSIYTEMISDSCGIHVHPDMQKLLIHNKGIDKTVLITDSTNFAFPNPENLAHVTDLNFDHNGGIAGSKLTMDKACRNIMSSTNCGIAQAFIMAALNPAKAVGLGDELGSIEPGKLADLVFTDDRFNVKKVMLCGEICVNNSNL